jgi:hypothetical protein
MRSRLLFAIAVALASHARVGSAQADRFTGGLTEGDYIRIGAGVTNPVNAQGGFRDWKKGTGFTLGYQNWGAGDNGVSRLGVSLNAGYSALALDEAKFIGDFTPLSGEAVTKASAGSGALIEVNAGFNVRFPSPLVVPTIRFGVGYIGWRPKKIEYTTASGSSTAKQQTRNGAEVSIGAGLERHFAQRFGIFGEANYVYGYTSLGQSSATPGGICANNGCDVLKNTSVTTIRGGLLVKLP